MAAEGTGKVLHLFRAAPEPAAGGEPGNAPAPRPARPDPLWRELAGSVLRAERTRTGRTLQQISERAGVSPQYLSEVERGRKDASSEMLESICGALGLSLADLLSVSFRTVTSVRTVTHERLPLSTPHSRPTGVSSMAA